MAGRTADGMPQHRHRRCTLWHEAAAAAAIILTVDLVEPEGRKGGRKGERIRFGAATAEWGSFVFFNYFATEEAAWTNEIVHQLTQIAVGEKLDFK